jgi:predicted GNAT family acetyltransferase
MTEVRRNDDAGRYEVLVDGEVAGFTEFRVRRTGVVVMPHTEVAEQHRGQGLATELIRGALDDLRRRGATVVARCPAVARFIDEHQDYQDLVAA